VGDDAVEWLKPTIRRYLVGPKTMGGDVDRPSSATSGAVNAIRPASTPERAKLTGTHVFLLRRQRSLE
jgi:hypothetical protein